MKAYAVRLAESHEPVGLFVVEHPSDLRYLVDEFCATQGMEYLRIGAGGLFFSKTDARWPCPADVEPDDFISPPFDSLTESWMYAVDQEGGWKPMPYL